MKKILCVIALSLATSVVFAQEFKPKEVKIVGGIKAASGAWPFMVGLLDTARLEAVQSGSVASVPAANANYQAQTCGASLIDEKWVLTAAHCVVDDSGNAVDDDSMKVLVGTSDLLSGGTVIDIKRIIVHPDYDPAAIDADIALIELKSKASAPTVSVSGKEAAIGTLATAIGWGQLEDGDNSPFPSVLYQVDLPVINRSVCAAVLGGSDPTANMLCAGVIEGGKDTCQGDSGGPLVIMQDGKTVQVGVTSWGYGCAQRGQYGVYTRLSKFDDWIEGYAKTSGSSGGGGGSVFFLLVPLFLIRLFRPSVKHVAQ